MYSTCIHCHASLGANQCIEAFPVGKRLAFDPGKGRLWAVCPNCRRWNLTPIEERWEAIEECEREFRNTRLRASTDNIGLARIRGGMELIRIGDPHRPEMAAWRYAGTFRRRWLRYGLPLAAAGGMTTLVPFLSPLGFASQVGAVALIGAAAYGYTWIGQRVRTLMPDSTVVRLDSRKIEHVRLEPVGDGWGITGGNHIAGVASGPVAAYALRSVMAARNFRGAERTMVDSAVDLLNRVGDFRALHRSPRPADEAGNHPRHAGARQHRARDGAARERRATSARGRACGLA